MEAVLVAFLFLNRKIVMTIGTKHGAAETSLPFSFVAGIVDADTSKIIATGAVISPHWVLTSAHLLDDDARGVNGSKYFILAGNPLLPYYPKYALTHPTYTWGLFTAEDFALFYVEAPIGTRPVLISASRFPWNSIRCEFMYWDDAYFRLVTPKSLIHFPVEVTVIQNCLARKEKMPVGILQFYLNSILCGTAPSLTRCVGRTGGMLYCENLLVGLLIRKRWCGNRTANFTDVGYYTSWLHSRVRRGTYVRLMIATSFAPAFPGFATVINFCITFVLCTKI